MTTKSMGHDGWMTFSFQVSDSDTPLTNLSLRATSSDQSLVKNENLFLFGRTNFIGSLSTNVIPFTIIPNKYSDGVTPITVTATDTTDWSMVSTSFNLFISCDFACAPPSISPIPAQAIWPGATTDKIIFTVSHPESRTLTITGTSSDQAIVRDSNILISPAVGPAGPRTLVISAEPNVLGTTVISVTVRADSARSSTTSFTLSVTYDAVLPFHNPQRIEIRDNTIADLYPSVIQGRWSGGIVSRVFVTLDGFTHRFPGDVDILLVSPCGEKVLLMSDAGGGVPVTGLTLRFDSAAEQPIGDSSIASGTFLASNYGSEADSFPAPAPVGPYSTNLSVFHGTNPNGDWQLYVLDDSLSEAGAITEGWSLDLRTEAIIAGLTNVITVENTPVRMNFTTRLPFTNSAFSVWSSDPVLVPTNDVSITGSETNWTMVITPAPNAIGMANVAVMPSGGCDSDRVGFTVMVTSPADQPVVSAVLAGNLLKINLAAKPGPWSIERSSDVVTWMRLGVATPDSRGDITFEVPFDSTQPKYEFFRARSW